MNQYAIEAAARAMAILDDHDGCFLEVDAWHALEEWEREAHPESYPGSDIEDCAYWLEKARAALEAAAPHLMAQAWNEGFTDAYYQERGGNLDGQQRDELPEHLVDDIKAWNRYLTEDADA